MATEQRDNEQRDNAQRLAADDFDADSVLSAPVSAGLTSLRSSVLNWRVENGRTYHAMSDGKYAFPNDERELDRLDLQHNMWLLTLRGQMALSPKEHGAKRVLDAGTGTGIWAIEYELRGFPSVPPNCSFEADDVEKEWTWTAPFDFIFDRILAGSLVSYEEFIKKAFANLEPGGYIELQEVELPYRCDDGTLPEDSDIARYGRIFKEACATIGRPMIEGVELEEWVKKAGFVNVKRTELKWPLNSWPRDKHHKEIGAWCHYNVDQGLEGLSLALFTRILGWSKEETVVFCNSVRKQFSDHSVHAYSPISVVYAQRPEAPKKAEPEEGSF
ncbi:hypothetical protein QQZ08_010285 [Neonectria magnoliae]|uniref:Uncharacterized protein n=1 Tax=Neonectria magnoliae TaxID=2732573 RepID=A0ABR1HI81_9HYPO